MMGFLKEDGSAVALLPDRLGGYTYWDKTKNKRIHVTRKNQSMFELEGYCFYKPLPMRKITVKELMKFIWNTLSVADIAMLLLALIASTFLGMLLPKINSILFSKIVQSNSISALGSIAVFLVSVKVSYVMIDTFGFQFQNRMKYKMKSPVQAASRESGMVYSIISGIRKIRLAGAENRIFAKWASAFAEKSCLLYNPPLIVKLNTPVNTLITSAGLVLLYYLALQNHIVVSDYYAFNTSYAMVTTAFFSLTNVIVQIAEFRPSLDMIQPILDMEPEVTEAKEMVTELEGGIDLSHVSFRYSEKMPMIVDDLSLKISPGQYVAIVGTSGCGKSTLLRLMLGLEKPQKGSIYYDDKDMSKVDIRSLRRKIGVVLQNGKLFKGSIFSNIIMTAPWATEKDAWEAAEMADLADDIRTMPMQIHTITSEGAGGISGGQKQRLMIARAVVAKPKILMMDEATSALDNVTQKKVSDALDRLDCTRVVVAHRLSTIRHCDRIIVLDKGKIVEDGTYDELMEKQGMFADLIARQQMNA